MGICVLALVGITAGALARAMSPELRADPTGPLGAGLLGVVGGVVSGWTWNLVFGSAWPLPSPGGVAAAVVGALLCVSLLRLFEGEKA